MFSRSSRAVQRMLSGLTHVVAVDSVLNACFIRIRVDGFI